MEESVRSPWMDVYWHHLNNARNTLRKHIFIHFMSKMDEQQNMIKCIHLTEKMLMQPRSRKKKNCEEPDTNIHIEDAEPIIPRSRVITNQKIWETLQLHLEHDKQYSLLTQISASIATKPDATDESASTISDSTTKHAFVLTQEASCMLHEIHRKISGYRCQDIDKHLYSPGDFVDNAYVIDLLLRSGLQCYYCKEHMLLLYGEVRNPKQWSLERIDNSIGHNKGNVEVACLACNIKRRTMYHERFLFTKQLGNIVKLR